MPHTTPLPGEAAPALRVERMGGETFDLASAVIDRYFAILFYRGVHCPACRKYLEELNGRLQEFEDAGVGIVVVSMDLQDRAKRQLAEWDIGRLRIGYGMDERTARSFGLFISEKIQDKEPDRFSEPGMVIVKPDRTIYAMFLQTVPWTRPDFGGLLSGLAFSTEKGFPPRGTAGV